MVVCTPAAVPAVVAPPLTIIAFRSGTIQRTRTTLVVAVRRLHLHHGCTIRSLRGTPSITRLLLMHGDGTPGH